MKKLSGLLCLLAFTGPALFASTVVLEKDFGGHRPPGSLNSGYRLYDSGVVVQFTGEKESPLATVNADIVKNAQKQVDAMVSGAKLEKLDPKQFPNPGGFVFEYYGHKTTGELLLFQKNVSGVDYGFLDQTGLWSARLLDSFGILNAFSTGYLTIVKP